MAILIIGGRYGSPASDEIDENGDYISVTQKEFRTAVNSGIPVYAFIEQAVSVEYDLYKLNRERFNDPEFKFEFSSVDSINVFKFIAELKSISGIPTVSFAKSQDIKDYLATQWADLFKKYLESLRRNTSNKKMTDSVEQMKILMDKMDVMLDTVGKKILTADNSNEYESVLEKQKVLAFCAELVNSLEILETDFVQDEKERRLYVERLLAVLKESVETNIWDIYRNMDTYVEFYNYFDERKIDLNWSDENFDDTIRKNINIFNKENLKQILIDEIMREKNYKKLFSEMKK